MLTLPLRPSLLALPLALALTGAAASDVAQPPMVDFSREQRADAGHNPLHSSHLEFGGSATGQLVDERAALVKWAVRF